VTAVVLVEGRSDKAAVEALAARRGRDLAAEGVEVVAMGGAQAIGRFLEPYAGARLAVLCDEAEEEDIRRGFDRAGLDAPAVLVCRPDLEAELIRALGAPEVEAIAQAQGELASFRTFQKQPAQQGKTVEQQLHRWMGNRKIRYAPLLVGALDLAAVPAPLDAVLAHV
jgi:hypothetical protein